MARVTVEDCILQVPNRFELVELAAQRAKHIASGATLTVPRDNDKDPVVALREIADLTIPLDQLREAVIQSYQKHHHVETAPTAADEEGEAQIKEAFADAQSMPGVERDEEDDEDEGDGEGDDPSFGDDNVDAED